MRKSKIVVEKVAFSGRSITEVKGVAYFEDENGVFAGGNLTMIEGWVALPGFKGAQFDLIPDLDTNRTIADTWPQRPAGKPSCLTLMANHKWEIGDDNFFLLFNASPPDVLNVDFASSFARATIIRVPYAAGVNLWGNRVTVGENGGEISVVHGRIVAGKNIVVSGSDGKVSTTNSTRAGRGLLWWAERLRGWCGRQLATDTSQPEETREHGGIHVPPSTG